MSELEPHVYEYEDYDRERGAGLRRRVRGGPPLEQLPAVADERLSDELIDELLAGARSEVSGSSMLPADPGTPGPAPRR
jgi:hypothetical protein